MPTLIADVSDFQVPVDPNAYRSVGITGIISKVSESNFFTTKTAAHNLAATRDAGLTVGGYHFLHLRDPGQADSYCNRVEAIWGGYAGMLHMLDVEQEANGKNPDIVDVREFAQRFAVRSGGHPLLIYSGTWYWRYTIGNPQDACGAGLVDASYVGGGGDPRAIVKQVTMGHWKPYGTWQVPLLRQYTCTARVPGEPFPVDVSVLYGTDDELNHHLGRKPPPPPAEPWKKLPTLRTGVGMLPAAADNNVRFLQTSLNILHTRLPVVVDGRFGAGTDQAVRDFQSFLHGKDPTVAVDGVCGPRTWQGVYFFLTLAGR